MTSKIDKLSDELWRRTAIDWHVSYCVTLTEPTCAVVSITSDYDDQPSIKGMFCKSREPRAAVEEVIEALLAKLPKNDDNT